MPAYPFFHFEMACLCPNLLEGCPGSCEVRMCRPAIFGYIFTSVSILLKTQLSCAPPANRSLTPKMSSLDSEAVFQARMAQLNIAELVGPFQQLGWKTRQPSRVTENGSASKGIRNSITTGTEAQGKENTANLTLTAAGRAKKTSKDERIKNYTMKSSHST